MYSSKAKMYLTKRELLKLNPVSRNYHKLYLLLLLDLMGAKIISYQF